MERLQLRVRFEFKASSEGILGLFWVISAHMTHRVLCIVFLFDVCYLDIVIEALLKYIDYIADLVTCPRVCGVLDI